jgi:hypothetical protein
MFLNPFHLPRRSLLHQIAESTEVEPEKQLSTSLPSIHNLTRLNERHREAEVSTRDMPLVLFLHVLNETWSLLLLRVEGVMRW